MLLGLPILFWLVFITGIKEGLGKKLGRAPGFYAIIVASTLVVALIIRIGIDPIKVLYCADTLYGLTTQPLIVMILLISNNKKNYVKVCQEENQQYNWMVHSLQ